MTSAYMQYAYTTMPLVFDSDPQAHHNGTWEPKLGLPTPHTREELSEMYEVAGMMLRLNLLTQE